MKTWRLSVLLLIVVSVVSAQSSAATAECLVDSGCEGEAKEEVFDPIGNFGGKINNFLKENIFNQAEGSVGSDSPTFPKLDPTEGVDTIQKMLDQGKKFFGGFATEEDDGLATQEHGHLEYLFESIVASSNKSPRSKEEVWSLFTTFFQESIAQLKEHFKDVDFDHFNLASVWYFIELMDEQKNPSWKRRQHRFHKAVPIDSIVELHDALYLSQLAYAGTVDIIEDGLKNFNNNTFKLIYAKTEGLPGEPGHFIAVKKEKKERSMNPFEKLLKKKDDALEVLMVVRGTKEVGDMLSDTLLNATAFRDGVSHSGVSKAGEWLAAEHLEMLRSLLDVSKRKKLKITLIGHSLGAGAAAIAAMHYKDEDWMDVSAIGFGCPAVLDLPQSVAVQDYIVTVITDADLVPRLSGAVMVNAFLDMMSNDWTAKALEDIKLTANWLNLPNQEGIITWADQILEQNDRPFFAESAKKIRMEQVLYPPGTCIHLFRDGSGFQATYTPCAFFDSIDVSRTMVDDHLVSTGYHRAFLEILRQNKRDYGAEFEHDLMSLDV